ncbi:MAG: hypothetical protein ACFFB0_18760 [Promethearchaeota archaeon]
MKSEKLTLYYLAKYTNHELLIDELVLTRGENQLESLSSNKARSRSIKIKIIRTKIFYAIIFGILPITPLLGYFQIADLLLQGGISPEIIIFHGSLFISLFFILQFFNFFLMGMLETGMIMSGRIFEWFQTLPITRKKLQKLVFLTIFRSFDVPIIVIIFAFPLIMFIGTLDPVLFLISIGISVINVIFSFSIIILTGARMKRILDLNEMNSRRSYKIRLFNIITYIIIILGSMYFIQWTFTSIDVFFRMFLAIGNHSTINFALSIIPYPFNPSYFVAIFIIIGNRNQVPSNLWISTIIGLCFFSIISFFLFKRALSTLEKITFSKFQKDDKSYNLSQIKTYKQIKIKRLSPFKAFLRKDLVLISHDLKTLMAIITSVILSFVFLFYYNLQNIGRNVPTEFLIYTNLVGILIFSPVLSGMLIFSFLSLEDSGQSVITSLPIVPQDQAKSKLLLIFIIQTIALVLPPLMFIPDQKFIPLMSATLIALPFTYMFLMIIFELKIHFFGKKKYNYVVNDVVPKNKLLKWVGIMSIQYCFCIWIVSFVLTFFIYNNILALLSFLTMSAIVGLASVGWIFIRMFPKIKKEKIVKAPRTILIIPKPTFFSKHPWISIISLIILYYYFWELLISTFTFYVYQIWIPFSNYRTYYLMLFIQILLSNFFYTALLIIIVPLILGLPDGRQPVRQYMKSIGLRGIISYPRMILGRLSKKIELKYYNNTTRRAKLTARSVLGIILLFLIILLIFSFLDLEIVMRFLSNASFLFWQEVLFRGIILSIFLNKYTKGKSIVLNSLLSLGGIILYAFLSFLLTGFLILDLFMNLYFFTFMIINSLISAFLYTKKRNLFLCFAVSVILYLVIVPYFVTMF